jgi:hypothetical protein
MNLIESMLICVGFISFFTYMWFIIGIFREVSLSLKKISLGQIQSVEIAILRNTQIVEDIHRLLLEINHKIDIEKIYVNDSSGITVCINLKDRKPFLELDELTEKSKLCPNAVEFGGGWASLQRDEIALFPPFKGYKCKKNCPICKGTGGIK